MAEHRIEITIDENGAISASSHDITGEMCLDELQELLDGLGDVKSIKKTDDYYKKTKVEVKSKIKTKK